MDPAEPANPAEITDHTKPADLSGAPKPTERADLAWAADHAEPADLAWTADHAEPADPAEITDHTEPADLAGATEPAERAGQSEVAERILAGLVAYAGGDALGVPWEGRPPDEIRQDELAELPPRAGWPPGSTSDDTALTLLVAEHLADAGGVGEPLDLLRTLSERWTAIPGLGPSTRRAIEHFLATGTPDDSGSDTNGAPMRALPIGWAVPTSHDERRREWVLALTRVTHTGRDALTAAAVMAACASWAVEGLPPDALVEVASREADTIDPGSAVAEAVALVARRAWRPPEAGVSLAPAETVAAVLHSCVEADGELATALRLAVSLGGDTDTVAALVGGLLGSRLRPSEIQHRLPWLDRVRLPPRSRLVRLSAALAHIRLTAVG